ncbi:zinc-binding dehydrogenase [Qipengyuania qiaonensis]|uniref:Zinc-binding dehydrogenase n=1 Tax=Qipengyuania qiaonensis TaxID=2867240 RepID=A0ABS7J7V9_9SPHN|nr:zinc-binding dehydrogenase [Qipengyuania qiaonensis]MBX7483003.1 zinc-binding dehydrogenase [Qipengyuania qiaonensis]
MRYAQLTRYGADAPFELRERRAREAGPFEVVVKVHAAGLNPADARGREGMGREGDPPPLGFDVSGVVTAVGAATTKFRPGDDVYGCAGGIGEADGSFSEEMTADERLLAHKPKSLSFREAAAMPLAVITAWEALVERAQITPGELVLVHGGTGGVGHFGVQLARATGAIVHATVSSAEKAELTRDLGAAEAINYRELEVADYVAKYTGGRGYDIVFDTVGGRNLEKSFAALATNGRVATTRPGDGLDLSVMGAKNATLHTVLMLIPLITGRDRERHGALLEKVARMVDDGRIRPLLDPHRFTLDQLGEALSFLDAGKPVGKLAVDIA